jgi:hypothetical protein
MPADLSPSSGTAGALKARSPPSSAAPEPRSAIPTTRAPSTASIRADPSVLLLSATTISPASALAFKKDFAFRMQAATVPAWFG